MATEALGDERPALFLRNATGLVRGWSVRDSLIYAVLATNFVTLGMYEFTFAGPAFPQGQMLTAVVISAILVSFLVVAYTGLIVTIPRAGGDYVWQSRILGSGLGFVMAATGWWFILWLWAPIYGNILSVQLFEPLWATLGSPSGAAWFGTDNGIFVVTLITIVVAGVLVSIGMAGYARIQKWAFYGCCCSIATPASCPPSTPRRTSSSASTTPTPPSMPRPTRPGTPRRRWASARSGRLCCWCRP
jgi:APA family basic amino acid/polyamine antiporter